MDSRDRQILEILRQNSRYTNTEIGNIIGVSEGTVRKRISKMIFSHTIKKFTVETSNDGVDGIVLVRVDLKKAQQVISEIKKKYSEIYEFSGKIDIAVGIHSASLSELNSAVDAIRNLDGVKSTDTLIRLT